jgi:predicted transglutaminase-like cysteine proteinase
MRGRVIPFMAISLALGASPALAQAGAQPAGQGAAAPDVAAAAPPCAPAMPATPTPAPPPPQADQGDLMPGTGVLFTMPADPADPIPLDIAACPVPPQRPDAPDVFGEAAVPVRSKLPGSEMARLTVDSLADAAGPWTEMLDQAKALADGERLDRVNRWVNWHVRYVDDPAGDHWSPAADTLRRGSGDCEDFAIAKMALLERLGIPAKDMFLIIVRPAHGRIDHAVLLVRQAGRMVILDNRTDMLLPEARVYDYAPLLSYNGPFVWIYGSRPAGASASPAAGQQPLMAVSGARAAD